eukprot:Em0008g1024a
MARTFVRSQAYYEKLAGAKSGGPLWFCDHNVKATSTLGMETLLSLSGRRRHTLLEAPAAEAIEADAAHCTALRIPAPPNFTVTLNEASIHEGAAALAAETRKHAANDARCQALGWSWIPLAVETFGNWGREAQCVFSRLATLVALRQGRSKSSAVRDIYGCLSISLFTPTLPSNPMSQFPLLPGARDTDANRGLQLLQRDQRGMEQKSTVGEQATTESTAATNRSGSNAPKSDSDEEFHDADEIVRPKPKENAIISLRQDTPPPSPKPFGNPDSFGNLFSLLASPKPYRKRLPILKDRIHLNIWSMLKNLVGKDVTKIALPVHLNEPLSFTQRLVEDIEYVELCHKAASAVTVVETLSYLAALASSCWVSTLTRYGKPFNPLLGETYELMNEEGKYCALSEQVSHHPPVTALHVESEHWAFWEEYTLDIKFRGQWVRIQPMGLVHFMTKKDGHHFTWNKPHTTIHNIILGSLWADHEGDVKVRCHQTGDEATVHFIPYAASKNFKNLNGDVRTSAGDVVYTLRGSWDRHMARTRPDGSEHVELWKANQPVANQEQQFGFTQFALRLNEQDETVVCPTDSRKRPDVRLLEDGEIDQAADAKFRLEEKQRAVRRVREQKKETWKPLWFDLFEDPDTNSSYYKFNSKYWDCKLRNDFSVCPDLY